MVHTESAQGILVGDYVGRNDPVEDYRLRRALTVEMDTGDSLYFVGAGECDARCIFGSSDGDDA